MNFLQALQSAEKVLDQAGENKDIAKLLMLHLTKMQPADLYASLKLPIDFDYGHYMQLVSKYADGVPLQHIRGYEYFYGRKFIVSPDVFIPRPETELLCDLLLDRIADLGIVKPVIADLCTGSGAIAVTIKSEIKDATVYAAELSEKALSVAKQNAEQQNADVIFLLGSFGEPLIQRGIKVDVLVCNPPYIPDKQQLEKRVANYDPKLALYGGADGLQAYQAIFRQMPGLFKNKINWLACFEIGFDQKEHLEVLAKQSFKNAQVEFVRDYANLWRVMFIRG